MDKIAEEIARALEDEYGNDWTAYMAVSKAIVMKLRRNGWQVCKWEKMGGLSKHALDDPYVTLMNARSMSYWLTGLEPPAAAITAALKETFKPNPSDNDDKPSHNRGP